MIGVAGRPLKVQLSRTILEFLVCVTILRGVSSEKDQGESGIDRMTFL